VEIPHRQFPGGIRPLAKTRLDLAGFRVGERVDRTVADRKRRQRERSRAAREVVSRYGYGYALGTAAVAAEVEARAVLGSDFGRFDAAVRRYVLAVDVAEHARAVWEAEGRPIRDKFANGMAGVSPYLKAWEQLAAQAMRFAGELGLTPASAKRISGVRGAGRPMGAASAAHRKALPPPILRRAALAALPDLERVNRARGHVED
jgi:hypothetical protein